jgi:hypothetical protein
MVNIIERVVSSLNGTTKTDFNVVTAKFWYKNTTIFPHKFIFYVGKDIVRVTTGDMNTAYYKKVKWEFGMLNEVLKLWNEFLKALSRRCPDLDFDLEPNTFHITSAKIMSDGVEQTFSSTSVNKPSLGGALIGGALFGGVGAIIGSNRSTTTTSGTTKTVFASDVLVTARYSNGFVLEGTISRKSSDYNRIMMLNS